MTACYSSHKITNFKLVVMVCLVFRCRTVQWISLLVEVSCLECHIMITFCMGCSSFEIQNKIQVFQKLLFWDFNYIWGKHHLLQELYVQSPIGRNWQWLLTIGKWSWHDKCYNLLQIKRKLSFNVRVCVHHKLIYI